jgi:hypothetical protein
MTVCIACIAEKSVVFTASDRMITAGDVEYEPDTLKSEFLSSAIGILWSGDAAVQAEILQPTVKEVKDRIAKEPDRWWTVQEAAELYHRQYLAAGRRVAEDRVLAPLGLETISFVRRLRDFSESEIIRLTNEMKVSSHLDASALVVGIDETGPHIWRVDENSIECHDLTGFAVIGVGRWHAESQLMLARHTPLRSVPETLFLIYSAKRRSEVAPGVGSKTDVLFYGPVRGRSGELNPEIVKQLSRSYAVAEKRHRKADEAAASQFKTVLDALLKEAQTKQELPLTPDPKSVGV